MSQSANPSRPRTPSATTAQTPVPVPPTPDDDPKPPQRKSSFSFLRRTKSTEKINGVKRSTSSGKLQKRSRQAQAEPVPLPTQPPVIPDFVSQPKLQEFGGDSAKGRLPYDVPIPRVPAGLEDEYSRAESITHRGRYSYASSAVSTLNSPRRVRRRKDPTPFNILIVGARNSGKSTFGEFLRASLALPRRKQRQSYYHPDTDGVAPPPAADSDFQSEYLETDIGGERIGLTVWDSEGLERNVVDLQLRRIVNFIESKFNETLTEETRVIRSPGAKDPHIHCVVLLLDPSNLNKTVSDAKKAHDAKRKISVASSKYEAANATDEISPLDERMDLQVLRALQGKTTVIPIISKADTITTERMKVLKRAVYKELKAAKLDPFEVLGVDDNDVEENSDSGSDREETSQRHDHRRFRESDEDKYRAQHDHTKSTFDLSDSESDSDKSVIHNANGAATTKKLDDDTPPPLPLSVLTPDPIIAHQPTIGATSREFPWGSADPYDPKHCDFVRFKAAVFQEWFAELREASRELWYEGWRTSRLDAPRARSATISATPEPNREPTIPVLSAAPGNAQATASPASKQASRNVSGGPLTLSPPTAQNQFSPPQRQYSPSLQQRSHPHSPAFAPPQELSASPIPSSRASPQPGSRLSPQTSQSMLQQKQSPASAQQLLQQQQQQSRQRGYSPFQPPSAQQVRNLAHRDPLVEQQEVGVAR